MSGGASQTSDRKGRSVFVRRRPQRTLGSDLPLQTPFCRLNKKKKERQGLCFHECNRPFESCNLHVLLFVRTKRALTCGHPIAGFPSNQLEYFDTFFLLLILTVETAGIFRYVLFVDLLTVKLAGIFRYLLSVADIDRRNNRTFRCVAFTSTGH